MSMFPGNVQVSVLAHSKAKAQTQAAMERVSYMRKRSQTVPLQNARLAIQSMMSLIKMEMHHIYIIKYFKRPHSQLLLQ